MRETDKTIQRVGTLLFIGMASFAIINNNWAEPERPRKITPTVTVSVDETVYSDFEAEYVVETMEQDAPVERETPIDELDLLARCIEAEAGTESLLGKRLVADVVLNRVNSPIFPDTITEVIYQDGQFAVVANGRIENMTPSAETYQAINLELESRIDGEIVYFQSGGYGYGEAWERVGNHFFSTN